MNTLFSAECANKNFELLEFTYMDKEELNKEYCEARSNYLNFLSRSGRSGSDIDFPKMRANSCKSYAATVKNVLKKQYNQIPNCSYLQEEKLALQELERIKNQKLKEEEARDFERLNPKNIDFQDGTFLICQTSDSIDIEKFISGKKKLSLTPEIYFRQVYSLKLKNIKKDIWKIKSYGKNELIKNIDNIDNMIDPYPLRRNFRHSIIDYDLIFISNNFSTENNEGIICVNDFSTVSGSDRSCIKSIKASDSYRTTNDKLLLSRRTLQYIKPRLTRGYKSYCKTSYTQNQINTLIENYEEQKKPYVEIKKHLNYVLENWDQGENKI